MLEIIGASVGMFLLGMLAGGLYINYCDWKKDMEARKKKKEDRWSVYFDMADMRKTQVGLTKLK